MIIIIIRKLWKKKEKKKEDEKEDEDEEWEPECQGLKGKVKVIVKSVDSSSFQSQR
jgi:hypothetical protein